MARAKQLERVERRGKTSRAKAVKVSKGEEEAQGLKTKVDFWSDEIRQVLLSQFNSLEEVIEAIIDRVLARLSLADDKAEQTKQFLREVILSDKEILKALSGVV